nr:MAG TPA: TRAF PROTEIN, TRAO PROTEIN, TRAN ADHESION, BACTERIAL SECRETION.5A [Caudoviricetes sp.]
MKKLIIFVLAAVLVSCSQQETLKVKPKAYVKKESKKKDYSEPYKDNGSDNGTFYYERSLDTIKVSDEYVIVAVYRCPKGISTVIVGKPTRLE